MGILRDLYHVHDVERLLPTLRDARYPHITAKLEGSPGPDLRIVFEGGRWGAHSLYAMVSTLDRIKAHWTGYLENQEEVKTS